MKKSFFFLSIIAAAILTSCGKLTQPDVIQVNPNPLAVVGNQVEADIIGTFPAKFPRRGVLTVTPVLKFEGREVLGQPMTYVGERAKVNGTVISYSEGGKYTQHASFAYEPAMDKCEMYLRFEATRGSKTYEIPDLKVADGLVATAKLAKASDCAPAVTPDKFQRIIQEVQEADIRFLIQQSNLRSSETKTQEMKDLHAAIKDAKEAERKEIHSLEVSGYASPDGGMNLNEKLATNRQKVAQDYLKKSLKKAKISQEVTSEVTAEDWAGFQAAMENSNIPDKELVLRVLAMYQDPEEREAQIKNLATAYKSIAEEVLPALRRSRLILTTDLIGKSDDEILELVKNDPAQLSVEEILYAATIVPAADRKAVYQKTAELYNDYRAYNNMGNLYMTEGNVAEARRCYAKALAIAPNNADVNYNAGVAAMAEGDLAMAQQYLGKAAGTTADVNNAMGTLNTMKGDYKAAQKAYGKTLSNNAAIQQILAEDYAGARQTLQNVAEPNAITAYLQAVVGARTNDREAVYSNLKVAVAKDASLKAKAQKDIEFAKYAEDAEFLAIVK